MTVMQKDGTQQDMVLSQCNYVPELWVNLFSVGKALKNGYSLTNKGIIMSLSKNKTKMTFDRMMEPIANKKQTNRQTDRQTDTQTNKQTQ